jgi:FkbH-like protein
MTDLPWLPRPAADLRTRLRALEQQTPADWGSQLRGIANQFLSISHAMAVAQTLERLRERGAPAALTAFRLGLVSNATTDFVKPFLIASALRYGIALEIIAADFGQSVQEAVDPGSRINQAHPHAILLALDHRGLPFRRADDAGWPLFEAQQVVDELATIRSGFRQHSGAVCLVQTLPAPAELLFGSLDAATSGTLRASIAAVNAHLARDVTSAGDVLIDVDWLAQSIGLETWYDERNWHIARMPFAQRALPCYADLVARVIGAMRGKSRKCLVLDLDNTIWGGVIGDDGMDGIALDPGDPRGEAFRAVQRAAADLRRRGVVLAVCSKNDEGIAREPFRSHPGMILRESDIAVFVANWDDKATNLERIAGALDLGIDSLVLLDDNPVERAQVRGALPQVAVPELGADPSSFTRILLGAGYFESTGFTGEDLARADQYRSNAERERALAGSRDLNDFLRSLEMVIEFAPFTAASRKRTTQLINKTNQFNVSTRRYTEQQVAAMEQSAQHYTLQVAVRDRFGDNGMISAVICNKRGEEWEIDSWLMSCRVLNRRVEQAVCNRIARDALRAGARRLIGLYLPTERNGIVRDLFQRLGFEQGEATATQQRWVLDLEAFQPLEVFCAEQAAIAPPAAASAV